MSQKLIKIDKKNISGQFHAFQIDPHKHSQRNHSIIHMSPGRRIKHCWFASEKQVDS